MKRLFFALICVFVFCFSVFARGGSMSGTKGSLNEIQTRYFDIIFPDSCIQTAQKIAVVCDSYYEEIASDFGYGPYQRFPVSITDQVESVNAYFSMAPYNHIVLYDTEMDYELDMNEKSVEAMFYHELVHAVSLNSKSPFWRGMSFFADFFTPAGISLTSFWFEGAAVAFESQKKGGRLNDPFFTQKITAAKLKSLSGKKKFPSWRDVSGARDIFPYGNDAYIFGSHFAGYLIQKYGKEKYAQFWKNAGSKTDFSFCAGIFYKTFGIKLDEAWNDFYEKLWVPEIGFDEYNEFISAENSVFFNSKKKSLVKTLDSFFDGQSGEWKTVWFDFFSNTVYLDSKKLFTAKNIQKLRFSDDGTKIFVNRLAGRSNIKIEDFEYDLKSKKKRKIEHNRENFEKTHGLIPVKNGLSWSLLYEDSKGGKAEWTFGDRIIHNVHFEKEENGVLSFVFVWAKMESQSLARLGKIFIDKNTLNAKIELLSKDSVAFFIEAVPCKDGFFVINEEYDSNPLRLVKIDENDWQEFVPLESKIFSEQNIFFEKSDFSEKTEAFELESRENSRENFVTEKKFKKTKYSPAKYFFNGAFLPVGMAKTYNHDFEIDDDFIWGATFITSTPWTDKITVLSAGFDLFLQHFALEGSISGGNDCFNYAFCGDVCFDSFGFKNSYLNSAVTKVFWQGFYSNFSSGLSFTWVSGTEKTASKGKILVDGKTETDEYRRTGNSIDGKIFLNFSTVRSFGPKHSQKTGFYFKPFVDFEKTAISYDFDSFGKIYDENEKYLNCGAETQIFVPFFLPAKLKAAIFPSKKYFASGDASIELFSHEIQKGIPAVSVYVQHFALKMSYSANVKYEPEEFFAVKRTFKIAENLKYEDFSDSLGFSGEITFAPNTSYFASSSSNFTLGAYLNYLLRTDKNSKWKAGFYAVFSNIAW